MRLRFALAIHIIWGIFIVVEVMFVEDITVPCGGGVVNIRVGAIIHRDNKILMATNSNVDYLYSIGGRIKFGESTEQAIRREVKEELGVDLEIERLGIVHESFFYNKNNKLTYEISFYYYMESSGESIALNEKNVGSDKIEFYEWVDMSERRLIYPSFLYEYAINPQNEIVYIYSDERQG